MWANDVVAQAQGAAWRRRQRRLQAHWPREQLTLQMLLATYEHHAAPRGQSRARSGGEARVVLHGRVPEAPPPPSLPGHPVWVSRGGPQARIQQRTMEQLADVVPTVQILDIPVPQMVEQLVEVPTVISFSSLQRTAEQHVDIRVPRRGGRHPGLQGLLSGQSSTASQLALERISERIVEQIVDFPVSRGGLQEFRPGQSSSSSHSPAGVEERADEPGEGVFALFPKIKKCEVGFALGSESARWCQPIHASSSAPCSSQAVGHDLG